VIAQKTSRGRGVSGTRLSGRPRNDRREGKSATLSRGTVSASPAQSHRGVYADSRRGVAPVLGSLDAVRALALVVRL
jgi:hypothetical protein